MSAWSLCGPANSILTLMDDQNVTYQTLLDMLKTGMELRNPIQTSLILIEMVETQIDTEFI